MSWDETGLERFAKKGWHVPPKAALDAKQLAGATWLIPGLDASLDPRMVPLVKFYSTRGLVDRSLAISVKGRWTEPGVHLGEVDYPSLALDGEGSFTVMGQVRKFQINVGLTKAELAALRSAEGDGAYIDQLLRALFVKVGRVIVEQLGLARYSMTLH